VVFWLVSCDAEPRSRLIETEREREREREREFCVEYQVKNLVQNGVFMYKVVVISSFGWHMKSDQDEKSEAHHFYDNDLKLRERERVYVTDTHSLLFPHMPTRSYMYDLWGENLWGVHEIPYYQS
jgi:hypothetical protein